MTSIDKNIKHLEERIAGLSHATEYDFNNLQAFEGELDITDSKGFHCRFGRIADISIWNRWLKSIEIRAIGKQRVSVDQTDLGQYFMENFNTKQSNTFRSILL